MTTEAGPLEMAHHSIVKNKVKIWVNEKGHSVHLRYEVLLQMFDVFFAAAGIPSASPYTIRKTATHWAARCNAKPWEIDAMGRWKSTR